MKDKRKVIIYAVIFALMYFLLSYGGVKLEQYSKAQYSTGIFEAYNSFSALILGALFALLIFQYMKQRINFKFYIWSAVIFLALGLSPFFIMALSVSRYAVMLYSVLYCYKNLLFVFAPIMLILGCYHKNKGV